MECTVPKRFESWQRVKKEFNSLLINASTYFFNLKKIRYFSSDNFSQFRPVFFKTKPKIFSLLLNIRVRLQGWNKKWRIKMFINRLKDNFLFFFSLFFICRNCRSTFELYVYLVIIFNIITIICITDFVFTICQFNFIFKNICLHIIFFMRASLDILIYVTFCYIMNIYFS